MSITIFIGDKDMWISSKLLFLVTLSFTLYACKPKENKQNKQQETDIQFINNRDLHYKILKITCDSRFTTHDIGYRVCIKLSRTRRIVSLRLSREKHGCLSFKTPQLTMQRTLYCIAYTSETQLSYSIIKISMTGDFR